MVARRTAAIVLLVGAAIALGSGLSTTTSFGPDLLLLVVIAVALAAGPVSGAATGFGGGLLMDLAPYSANLVGTAALAFTVVGYLAGAVSSAWRPANRLLRFLWPIVLAGGAVVVVALVFGCSTVLFHQDRFGWTGVPELLRNSAAPTIMLAPVMVPGLVGLLGRKR